MDGIRGDLNERAQQLAAFLQEASDRLQEVAESGRAERMDFIEKTRDEVERLAGETERFITSAETERLRAFAANSDERAADLKAIFDETSALIEAVSQDMAEAHEAFFGIFAAPAPKPRAPAAAAKPTKAKAAAKKRAPKKKAARKR